MSAVGWRLMVWESKPHWVIRLRQYFVSQRGLTGAMRQIVGVSDAETIFTQLAQFPAAAVCWVTSSSNVAQVVPYVGRQTQQFHSSLPLVVAEDLESEWWPILALSGAVWWCTSVQELPLLARILERHARWHSIPPSAWWSTSAHHLPWADWFRDNPVRFVEEETIS